MEVVDTVEDDIFKLKIKTLEDSIMGTSVDFQTGEEEGIPHFEQIRNINFQDESQN